MGTPTFSRLFFAAFAAAGLLQACASAPVLRAPSNIEDRVPAARRTITADYVAPDDVSRIKVAFFDADSTLRVSLSGSVSANHPTDVRLLPYMSATLRDLAERGFLIYIVSNQGGVAAGAVTLETANAALRHTVRLIREDGGVVHGYDFAEDDVNRKPKSGMKDVLEAELRKKYGANAKIDLAQSLMVGDSAYKKGVDFDPTLKKPGIHFSNADRLFAEEIGVKFYEPADFFGWRPFGTDIFVKAAEVEAFVAGCAKNPACFEKLRLSNCAYFLGPR